MPVKPPEEQSSSSLTPEGSPYQEPCIQPRDVAEKIGIKSELVVSGSDVLPMKKLQNSNLVPSSDPCFTPDDILLEKQAAREQDSKQAGQKVYEDTNGTSPNSTMMEGSSQSTGDESSPDSSASSSFEKLSLSSGPQPASDVHSSPRSDLLSSFIIKPEEYPAKFKQPQYDCLLVHSKSDSDKKSAMNFKKIIEKCLLLEDNRPPRVCILDDSGIDDIQSCFEQLNEAVERSTIIFLFMTEEFINDSCSNLQKDECLMISITDPAKKWCVVPLHTQSQRDFKYPFGLRALKGMDVWNMVNQKNLSDLDPNEIGISDLNEHFRRNLTALFNLRLSLKLERERKQEEQLQKWIIEEQLKRAREAHIRQQEQSQSEVNFEQPPSDQQQTNTIIEKLHRAGLSVHDIFSALPKNGVNVYVTHCDNLQVGSNNVQHVNTAEASVDNSSLSTDYEIVEESQQSAMDVCEETMPSDEQNYNNSQETTYTKQAYC